MTSDINSKLLVSNIIPIPNNLTLGDSI